LYTDYKDVANVAAGNNGTWTTALFVGYTERLCITSALKHLWHRNPRIYTRRAGSLGSKERTRSLCLRFVTPYSGTRRCRPGMIIMTRTPTARRMQKGDIRNYVLPAFPGKLIKTSPLCPTLLYETYEAPVGKSEPDPSITARLTVHYVVL